MTEFDPKKLRLGDLIFFRKTIHLPAPEIGVTAVSDILEGPNTDVEPHRFMTTISSVSVNRADANYVDLVGAISVVPEAVLEYQESLTSEAKAREMQALLEEDD